MSPLFPSVFLTSALRAVDGLDVPLLKACLSAGLLTLLLTSCGRSNESQPGQTIARAAGIEITVHELQHGLKGVSTDAKSERRFLESMVDQTLLAQKAVESGLDKDPKVALTLAAARRSVLAQAYAEKSLGAAPNPTEVELKAYYDANPQLFAGRRIYTLRDSGFPKAEFPLETVRAKVNSSKNLEAVIKSLTSQQINVRQRTVASEDLPLEVRNALSGIKRGGMGTIALTDQTQVIEVSGIEDAPVSFAIAKPTIARLLVVEAQRGKLEKTVLDLREQGKVEYLGQYSVAANKTEGNTEISPNAGNKSVDQKSQELIDRGISTLR